MSGRCFGGIGLYLDGGSGCLQCSDVLEGYLGAHPLQSGDFAPF